MDNVNVILLLVVCVTITGMICNMWGYYQGREIGKLIAVITIEDVEEIRQAEIDCLVKEYYYMDEHRQFCDMIGVKP